MVTNKHVMYIGGSVVSVAALVFCASHYRIVSIEDDDAREDLRAVESLRSVGAMLGTDSKGRVNWLSLEGAPVSSVTVRMIRRLRKISHLDLSGTSVTDAQLIEMVGALDLVGLNVERTSVSDAVMPSVARQSNMRRLLTAGSRISDAGVREYLLTMSRLENVSVGDNISEEVIAKLSRLPQMGELMVVNATGERYVVRSGERM